MDYELLNELRKEYHKNFKRIELIRDWIGRVYLYDFDAASIASPLYDMSTMCDDTDYFSLEDTNFISGSKKTLNNLNEF